MTNPTPHRQVPEALIDLIDAYAETRHRCGGIYNARKEAARKAVIEALSGVQALSAAPWVPELPESTFDSIQAAADAASVGHLSRLLDHQSAILAGAMKSMRAIELAASPINESQGDFDARIPYHEWASFVESRAALLHDLKQSPVASPTPPAEQQAAPKAAPGERRNTKTHDLLSTVVGVLMGYREGAARQPYKPGSTIDNVVSEVIEHLKDWPYPEAAPQQEAQEPAMTYHGRCTIDCGEGGHHDMEMLRMIPAGSKLYTAPQPAPAPVSDDTERLEWLLWKLPGDALRYVVGELADTSSGSEFRAAIDAAIAAQGGKA